MYNHVWVLFKPADQVLALTWDDIRVQLELVDSVPFQFLFWPCGYIVWSLSVKHDQFTHFIMYNHVWVLFKPADQVLALTWDDIRVQLELVDSVPFQFLFWPCGYIVWSLSVKHDQFTHFIMYNHVWVSFKPADQVLALTWGDICV